MSDNQIVTTINETWRGRMLELAIKSGLPLISIETTDTINVQKVVRFLGGHDVVVGLSTLDKAPPVQKVILMNGASRQYEEYYHYAVKHSKVMVFVNLPLDERSPLVFDAGVLPVPVCLVESLLKVILPDNQIPAILSVLGGLTLKDVAEVCRLAMTETGELTPASIIRIRRRLLTKLPGLELVNSETKFYKPDAALFAWQNMNHPFFFKDMDVMDERMMPRGLLICGEPGTGKTEAAKYIARVWSVPLYRLDVSGMMSKWLGASEAHLKKALQTAEQESPCILLIDEVEKLFQKKDSDEGSTSRMLSQLLWWLQEHRSRIVTVMTTNDLSSLPKELYRPGRIDSVMHFGGVKKFEADDFVYALLDTVPEDLTNDLSLKFVTEFLDELYESDILMISQAELTQELFEKLKEFQFDK
jgi:hypothetical protein